jgi:hypothetical protein
MHGANSSVPFDASLPQFFIPVFDRAVCLLALVEWLFKSGIPSGHIHLVDMGTTYKPCLELMSKWKKYSGVNVHKTGNVGARGLFKRRGIIEQVIGRKAPFFLSDPDVCPARSCRSDLLNHLVACMKRYTDFDRIGLALEITDIPDHFPFKSQVVNHEKKHWTKPVNAHLCVAPVATTFCLVRSLNNCDERGYAKKNGRTLRPNTAYHSSWYLDPKNLPEDEEYYYKHAPYRAGTTGPGFTFGFKGGQPWKA